jgi:hypothetical protein
VDHRTKTVDRLRLFAESFRAASNDKTARIWDVRLAMMSAKRLLAETCARFLNRSKLTREEMRLAGYFESTDEIDVCHYWRGVDTPGEGAGRLLERLG